MAKNDNPYIPQYATSVRTNGNVTFFEVPAAHIVDTVRRLHADHKLTLKLIDATDERTENDCFKVWYVFGMPGQNAFIVPYITLKNAETFPSVVAVTQGASGYERKIYSFFGLRAQGNPDQRAMILHENWPEGVFPLRKDFAFDTRPPVATTTKPYAFEQVDGEGIYEIPVGPIHAGIIEPGHFRFGVAGESIMLLEARLGYVHKGIEKLFERLPLAKQLHLAEKISGDSSFSHALAFCQAVEQLGGVTVPVRAQLLRIIFAELERIAHHVGDIGFIMLDTGYSFGGANGARLREMVVRINERLSGHRFLRGVAAIGGVSKDISAADATQLVAELQAILRDFNGLVDITETADTLVDRLKTAGPLDRQIAIDFGALGVAARAVGLQRDARVEHPYAAYGTLPHHDIALGEDGDVYARFWVRVQEVRASIGMILDALAMLPEGPIAAKISGLKLAKQSFAVGCVEGWRGEIMHCIVSDADGAITRVMVRDPSFINWQVLGTCGQGQIVPDFPLINKSFNLSYTGNDL